MENSQLWGSTYGGCYRIWSGTSPEMSVQCNLILVVTILTFFSSVVSKSEHIKTAFNDSDRHFKADNNDSGYLMSQVLGKCLGLISGKAYSSLRSILDPFFTYGQSGEYLDKIQPRTERYLQEMKLGELSSTRSTMNPVDDFKFLPFLIIADILYGKLTPELETELLSLAPLREKLFQHVIAGGLSRFKVSKHLPTEANRMLRSFRHQWVAFNTRAYGHALAEGLSDTVIVQLFDSAKQGTIDWEHCYQTLDEILFANLDVTMGALSWNLVYLADNPSIQTELRNELAISTYPCEDESATHVQREGSRRYLQSSTTLLAACILESARLKPLAAFTVPQSAPTDRLIHDYKIPAKTNLVVDTYALNINNEYWGEDRYVYRPQRFLDLSRSDLRYRYWRFGFGPRQCLGKYVAELILRVIIATMVRKFVLHMPIDESKDWKRDKETWISHPKVKMELESLHVACRKE